MTNIELIQLAFESKGVIKSTKSNTYFSALIDEQGQLCICRLGDTLNVRADSLGADAEFKLVEGIQTEYKKGAFSLSDDLSPYFEGYGIESWRWNGWAIPLFEIGVAKQIMDHVNNTMGEYYSISRDDLAGKFVFKEYDYDSVSDLDDFVINVDGKNIVVVSFLGGNWAWDGYYYEEAEEVMSANNIASSVKVG